jgi:hypothetical protein
MKSAYVALMALSALGCSKETSVGKSGDTSVASGTSAAVVLPTVTMPMPASVIAQQSARPSCPHDGKWELCSVVNRLRQSGFVVKPADSASLRRKGFSVRPVVYTLGQSRVEIFLYSDSAALAKDIAAMDTLVAGPRGVPSQWGDLPPVLVRSANLAAVFLSSSQRQAERFALAITAGPPMAGSPR